MNCVLVNINEHIGYITINRPQALNALNRETLSELNIAILELAGNKDIAVIILTGAGDKAFVAGADIKEMENMSPQKAKEFALLGNKVFELLENIEQPVIAAVNGFALGGGCELAMACDIRYASENARFGQPETGLGITPGFGGTQRLPRLIGKGAAMEMLLSGKIVNAAEAYRLGLVQKVAADVMLEAEKFAQTIAAKGPFAVRQTKQVAANGLNIDLKRALAMESEAFALCFSSPQQREGMAAFGEKRTPKFT